MKYKHEKDIISRMYKEFPATVSEIDIKMLRSIQDEFTAGFKLLANQGPFVTTFGSARIKPGDPVYALGVKLGEALAKEGYAVLTGGGPGCMEAVNKGAKEANGKSMGINISIPIEQNSNPYAIPSITMNHFFVRKVLLLKFSTAYIFLPGGYGTLDELFETITLVQNGKIKKLPIILIDTAFWHGLMEWINERLITDGLIGPNDTKYFKIVDTVEEAIEVIRTTLTA
ncbi:MAG: TIGR00730 family Rossman fold protein [Nitrospinota bacterium]|nr:TIGR00730 family Rossman fold protein [Nitrospinota bacterium]